VVEEEMVLTGPDGIAEAVATLSWSAPPEPRDDRPWLMPWLHGKRTGLFLPVASGEAAADVAARALSPSGTSSPRHG